MNSQGKLYTPLGLYVHVPFCAVPCAYCAFYKERPTKSSLERYITAICQEISQIDDSRAFDSIYFGGGTPGILPIFAIDQIADTIHQRLHQEPKEWTVEIAPSTISQEKLQHWYDAGVNRISMGIQSFQPEILRTLGRHQTPMAAREAYTMIRQVGFQNVGLDLIFAAPGQTRKQLIQDLTEAVVLRPEHISTYCLTYEAETPMTQQYGDGADEVRDSGLYELICETLPRCGFQQYEISNFAYPGFESLHNLSTWRMGEWIGVGPSASSQYCSRRYTNVADLARWAQGVFHYKPERTDIVELTPEMLALDRIIFGLRTTEGVYLENNVHAALVSDYARQELLPRGFATLQQQQLRLTPKGRLLCDAIAREIFFRVN
ncbi:MAG: radical SAM family heme chaperone HemW [Opitutales bacterium]|nr:radical SAM family heme chaperone HemW [Opitutales bacterium]